MQLPRLRTASASAVALLALSGPTVAALSLDCEHIRVEGANFNLGKLKGPHSVVTTKWLEPSHVNTTYTLDLCRNLVKKKGDACPNGTRGEEAFPPFGVFVQTRETWNFCFP